MTIKKSNEETRLIGAKKVSKYLEYKQVLYTNQKKKNGGKILHVNQTTVSEML
jgi:hypothetical protein